MELTAAQYTKLAAKSAPKSPAVADCVKAFLVGGTICTVGQLLIFAGDALGLQERMANMLCTVSLIALSILLTGLGWYSKIAKHAGAGTLVPITGFANAIAAPAIEFKSEGLVLGLSAQMFVIAGPVIVYGTVASVIYGLIYLLIQLM
ncbi:MAG: stage V sporulation protein AC [Ruminococcaceae bacterium]|nr:stage V sporulation protein AC [Oscillospiraceae bacterium]